MKPITKLTDAYSAHKENQLNKKVAGIVAKYFDKDYFRKAGELEFKHLTQRSPIGNFATKASNRPIVTHYEKPQFYPLLQQRDKKGNTPLEDIIRKTNSDKKKFRRDFQNGSLPLKEKAYTLSAADKEFLNYQGAESKRLKEFIISMRNIEGWLTSLEESKKFDYLKRDNFYGANLIPTEARRRKTADQIYSSMKSKSELIDMYENDIASKIESIELSSRLGKRDYESIRKLLLESTNKEDFSQKLDDYNKSTKLEKRIEFYNKSVAKTENSTGRDLSTFKAQSFNELKKEYGSLAGIAGRLYRIIEGNNPGEKDFGNKVNEYLETQLLRKDVTMDRNPEIGYKMQLNSLSKDYRIKIEDLIGNSAGKYEIRKEISEMKKDAFNKIYAGKDGKLPKNLKIMNDSEKLRTILSEHNTYDDRNRKAADDYIGLSKIDEVYSEIKQPLGKTMMEMISHNGKNAVNTIKDKYYQTKLGLYDFTSRFTL